MVTTGCYIEVLCACASSKPTAHLILERHRRQPKEELKHLALPHSGLGPSRKVLLDTGCLACQTSPPPRVQ